MKKKVYVQVVCTHLDNGAVIPHEIWWQDGRRWSIRRVLHTSESPDDLFEGIRYAVLINRSTRYLYQSGDRWYVETTDKEGA